MAGDMRAFLPEKSRRRAVQLVVSERFRDGEGRPAEWVIEPLGEEWREVICEGGAAGSLGLRLLARAVRYPDLRAVELQEAYGVLGEEQLLLAMLSPGEFQVLARAFIEQNF